MGHFGHDEVNGADVSYGYVDFLVAMTALDGLRGLIVCKSFRSLWSEGSFSRMFLLKRDDSLLIVRCGKLIQYGGFEARFGESLREATYGE